MTLRIFEVLALLILSRIERAAHSFLAPPESNVAGFWMDVKRVDQTGEFPLTIAVSDAEHTRQHGHREHLSKIGARDIALVSVPAMNICRKSSEASRISNPPTCAWDELGILHGPLRRPCLLAGAPS